MLLVIALYTATVKRRSRLFDLWDSIMWMQISWCSGGVGQLKLGGGGGWAGCPIGVGGSKTEPRTLAASLGGGKTTSSLPLVWRWSEQQADCRTLVCQTKCSFTLSLKRYHSFHMYRLSVAEFITEKRKQKVSCSTVQPPFSRKIWSIYAVLHYGQTPFFKRPYIPLPSLQHYVSVCIFFF